MYTPMRAKEIAGKFIVFHTKGCVVHYITLHYITLNYIHIFHVCVLFSQLRQCLQGNRTQWEAEKDAETRHIMSTMRDEMERMSSKLRSDLDYEKDLVEKQKRQISSLATVSSYYVMFYHLNVLPNGLGLYNGIRELGGGVCPYERISQRCTRALTLRKT